MKKSVSIYWLGNLLKLALEAEKAIKSDPQGKRDISFALLVGFAKSAKYILKDSP